MTGPPTRRRVLAGLCAAGALGAGPLPAGAGSRRRVLILGAGLAGLAAGRALHAGKSLLPIGVTEVTGRFGRGDPVELADETGRVLGQGLTRYDSDDADRIKRLRLDQIEAALGHPPRGPLVHRDDMVLLR